jgi:hypothetical protein
VSHFRDLYGWAGMWSNRQADALPALISVAGRASVTRMPITAWQALALAATVAYQSGTPSDRQAVLATLDRMDELAPAADWGADRVDTIHLWIRASTDPFGRRKELIPLLGRIAGGTVGDPATLGAAAWLLDETDLAIKLLRELLSQESSPGVRGRSGAVLSALQWAYIDRGRWDETLSTAREAADIAAAYKMDTIAA